ncbi:hypothetical protein KI387_038768, partial [Taxus chinensis]
MTIFPTKPPSDRIVNGAFENKMHLSIRLLEITQIVYLVRTIKVVVSLTPESVGTNSYLVKSDAERMHLVMVSIMWMNDEAIAHLHKVLGVKGHLGAKMPLVFRPGGKDQTFIDILLDGPVQYLSRGKKVCKTVDKFLSSFRAVFEVRKEKHSRCPKCKGSGLMIIAGGHASNEPCWFCEGVGIMPIIGLEGFFLVKASSQINTRDLMVHSLSPVPCEQSLINHTGTRCKITRYKPAVQICNFLPQVAETPPSLTDLEREAHLINADLLSNHALCGTLNSSCNLTQVKNEIAFPSKYTSVIDSSKISKTHNGILKFIREVLDISKASIEVQPKECPAYSLVTQCSHKHSQSNKSTKVGQVEKGFDDSKRTHFMLGFGSISSLDVFLIVSALKFALQKKRSCLWTSPFNHSILTGSGTRAHIHFGMALPTVRHAKMNRNSRRGRNCIREKAQKEANENARRILQSLTPRTSNMFNAPPNETPPPNEIPGGVLSVTSAKEDRATDIHIRSENLKRLLFSKFQNERSILERTTSKNQWMKNFSFELLKEKGLSFTNP